jgi:hypothetical protein
MGGGGGKHWESQSYMMAKNYIAINLKGFFPKGFGMK